MSCVCSHDGQDMHLKTCDVLQGCFLQPNHWSLANSYIIKLGKLVSFAQFMYLVVPLVSKTCVCCFDLADLMAHHHSFRSSF